MKKSTLTFAAVTLALAFSSAASADTIYFEFEQSLADNTGQISFSVDAGTGIVWTRSSAGVDSGSLTNPVPYADIGDSSPLSTNPSDGTPNEWFLRSDHVIVGGTTSKPGDGDTGDLSSGTFLIDENSGFTFDLGGGATNGIFLHRASDDSEILSEFRGNGHLEARDWTSGELAGAGVSGSTEVYIRISDNTTGGWGHVQVDNIVVSDAAFVPEPTSLGLAVLAISGLGLLVSRRRRR